MKLIKILRQSKIQFLIKLPSNNIYLKSLGSICILILVSAAIWLGAPDISWGNQTPFAQPEKRFYIILSLFLLWLLKFLLLDMDAPNSLPYKDEKTRKKIAELQNRFDGAMQFLKKTTTSKQGHALPLNELPWYLLIGPHDAGKTTLLANSQVNFILQKRLSPEQIKSENCDWWVTRDACIIDVPGHFLTTRDTLKNPGVEMSLPLMLWRSFLGLVKKQKGNAGVSGIIIALPLPEIIKQGDLKKYHALLADLFQRIREIQKIFPQSIPCQLVITKCDLLPGFTDFFAESANDEIGQAWGVTLTKEKNSKPHDVFIQHFNALIKKLNQQLLWRLHQERNPMARPYIKDFPLQVERLKEFISDFIKKSSYTQLNLFLRGVYLTSAAQSEPETNILEESLNTTQRALQLFQQPAPASRAYFIKQFITSGLAPAHFEVPAAYTPSAWKRRAAYAASVAAIIAVAVLLGRDFERGIKQTYAVQANLAEYRLAIQQAGNPNEHLAQALLVLNALQQSAKKADFKLDMAHLLSFYSDKSYQKAGAVYQQALRTILLPEVKNYLGEYLTLPINKNSDSVYAALKAYLMMGDKKHLQAPLIVDTVRQILPKSMTAAETDQLMHHLQLALQSQWTPLALDTDLIAQTRKYFIALPNFQLSYIILKNINGNTIDVTLNLGLNTKNTPVFITRETTSQIPSMFTAKTFPHIVSKDATLAAQETLVGNWVLGEHFGAAKNAELIPTLVDQLRSAYLSNYIEIWETLLRNIHLSAPKTLEQLDVMIINLISTDSPLLQLLQTLHDNTYFEPILTASPKLQNLGSLLDKRNQSENLLYQIFSSLQSLHIFIQSVLTADNEKKAAFQAVSGRMQNHSQNNPDAITQLRIVAEKCPEPLKNWLEKIANDTWHFLMQDAAHYLDTSWNNQVIQFYRTDIADRYPFGTNATQEVDINKFIAFFGKPGIVFNFYNQFLQPFVDTSATDWHWKTVDDKKLPFNDETLRQIQLALRINHTFFPNGDDKLFVQFALQPYQFGKQVRRVKLNINDKQIVDEAPALKSVAAKNPHVITWPSNHELKMTSIQLITAERSIRRIYPGAWGWFKLVNESFESVVSKKEVLLNLSMNENSAKYLLFTNSKYNPFLSLNLRYFILPQQITDKRKA